MIEIKKRAACCGCSACFSSCPVRAITMKEDPEGFRYPSVDWDLCVSCGLCERVCPMDHTQGLEKKNSLYAAIQAKGNIRETSTAGGAFTLVAQYLIEEKKARIYAVGYDSDMNVCHTYADRKEDLAPLRGSKYVQSDLTDTYKRIKGDLKEGRCVLFVGTPCQVHGLINYMGGQMQNLYTMDLLCLGVTSPGLFAKYIDYLQKKYKTEVEAVQFRNKHFGYSTPNVRVVFRNGKYIQQTYDSKVHANLFFKKYYNVRPSCYACRFRETARVSDFTIGDFTDIGTVDKAMDDDLGTTKIWLHTEKAKQLLAEIESEAVIKVLDPAAANVVGGRKKQIAAPSDRAAFFKDAGEMNYQDLVQRWEPNSLKNSYIGLARTILNQMPGKQKLFQALRKLKNQRLKKQMEALNQ